MTLTFLRFVEWVLIHRLNVFCIHVRLAERQNQSKQKERESERERDENSEEDIRTCQAWSAKDRLVKNKFSDVI